MKIVIEIKCDNAAFEDAIGSEAARILRVAAVLLEEGKATPDHPLRDTNGNRVGFIRLLGENTMSASELGLVP